jgi:hypothetical protein
MWRRLGNLMNKGPSKRDPEQDALREEITTLKSELKVSKDRADRILKLYETYAAADQALKRG